MKWIGILGAMFLLSAISAVRSQEATAGAQQKKVIKKAPIKNTGYSGADMYREYCAVCHGKDGKGDGPAASELKTAPADLTVLAENNGGKYPADHVAAVLRFGVEAPAHGSKEMPIWGDLFGALHHTERTDALVNLRISNLTDYIQSLQTK